MRRKFLSVVLCVCMMLTMAPFAFATDSDDGATTEIGAEGGSSNTTSSGSGGTTLQAQINAIDSTGTITLNRTYTEDVTIPANKNITLNLNGQTLKNVTTDTITVENGATLTVTGTGTVDNITHGKAALYNKGTVVLEGGTFERSAEAGINATNNGGNSYYTVLNHGSMTVKSNVTVNNKGHYSSLFENGYFDYTKTQDGIEAPSLIIDGGKFDGGLNTIKNDDNATLTINDGTFINYTQAAFQNHHIATINGGTFTATDANAVLNCGVCSEVNSDHDNHVITINNGTFAGAINRTVGTISISGGTYSVDVSDFCAEGYYSVKDGEKYTVKPLNEVAVAKIGDNLYTSLSAAISAATDGQTITLLKDTALTSSISIEKNVTLDLGGKTLSRKGGMLLDIYGNVTIQNGTVAMTGSGADIWVNQTANLTVEKSATISAPSNSFAIAYYQDCTAAEVTLKGTLTGEGSGITVNGNIKDKDSSNQNTSNKLILDGTTINVKGHGVYQAGYATTTFTENASTITGSTGIEVRAGNLTVTNSTITGNGTFKCEAKDNGTTTDGVGIAIAQHTTQLPINVTISGGTISGKYAVYESNPQNNDSIDQVNLFITGGNFNGSTAAVYSQDVKDFITGGLFSSDPSAYCGKNEKNEQLTGVENTDSATKAQYPFTVGVAATNAAAVATADPEIKSKANPSTEVDKALSTNVISALQTNAASISAAGSALDAAAKTVAQQNTETPDSQLNALKTATGNNQLNPTDVHIVVQSYLDIKVTDVDATTSSITLDITPMYQKVATTVDVTATSPEQIITDSTKGSVNAVEIGSPQTLNVSGPVTLSIPLPDSFASVNAYVQHKGYEYTATVVNNVATFVNPHGFSSFTITADRTAVAEVNGTSYINFQDAVDAVENGGTIEALQNIDSTVSGNKSFKVNENGKTVKLTAASGYNLTKDTTGVYTVSHQSSGGPGSSGGSISAPTTYNVKVNAATNGAVAADKKTASKGTTVTVTASPSKGYVVDAVKVVDKDGKDVAVTGKDGKYVFTMPASAVTVTGSFKAETPAPVALPFSDVKSGNWFYDAVKYAYAQGLMTGTSATTFAPNGTMNRAMIVTVLYRLEKSPAVTGASKFTDVPAGQWYSDAVAWAAANKIVNGYDETTFGPMNAVTREQMAAILFRYEQVKGLENVTLEENLNRFPDQNKISAYAIPALQWAVGQKIINGNADGTLDPTGTATRAQVAQIFTNLLNK